MTFVNKALTLPIHWTHIIFCRAPQEISIVILPWQLVSAHRLPRRYPIKLLTDEKSETLRRDILTVFFERMLYKGLAEFIP